MTRPSRGPLRPTAIAVSAVALLVAACSSSGGGPSAAASPSRSASASASAAASATPTGTSAAPVPAAPSATDLTSGDGCALPTSERIQPGHSRQAIDVGGVSRTYLLDVPKFTATARLPVVLSFHGFGQTDDQYENYTQLAAGGRSAGYVVVTPQGLQKRWNFVRRAAVGSDDVAMVTAILDNLSHVLCLSSSEVYATGLSDGADMADALACALPGRLAAVAMVAASWFPQPCAGPLPSMLEIHGNADPVVPFNGGGGDRAAPFQGTQAQPVLQRAKQWASLAGCGTATSVQQSTASTQLVAFKGCPAQRDVGVLVVDGGGHTWPGATPIPSLGTTDQDLSADQVILLFFQGHPRH